MRKGILIGIVILGFLLRLVGLSNHPVGFNADEASFGYDAYSILKTGRDQWGQFMPVVLKSFGDFKSPLYAYLTVPSVFIFGLTKFAVRVPNVLVGSLAIYFVYLLSGELAKLAGFHEKERNLVQLSGALLLAVSPWHIMMSRGAFEANLITLFLPAGIYFFLRGLKKSKFLIASGLFFGLSLFTYHSAKLIAPVIVLGLAIIFRQKIRKLKTKNVAAGLVIFLVFFVGLLYTFHIGGGSRISERSITQGATEAGAKEKIALIQDGQNPFVAKILHNKYQVIVQRFIANYQQYFLVKFLFQSGAGDTSYGMIPYGVLYAFDGLLLLGVIYLLFRKEFRFVITALIFWLLIAPLPAALATGVGYSGNRAEGMIPVLQILEAFGVIGWLYLLKIVGKSLSIVIDRKLILGAGVLFCILGTIDVGMFINFYFLQGTNIASRGMLYGSLESGEWLVKNSDQKNVIVTRALSEPQIFIAFANKWDPGDYQKATKNWTLVNGWVDQQGEYSLGKYVFKSIDYKVDSKLPNTLIVGSPGDFPSSLKPYYVINYPDFKPIYEVIVNK